MTRTIAATFAIALAACTGGNGNAQGNAAGNAAAPPPAPAAAPVPAPGLGPLTAEEICDRLSAATVAEILGFDPTAVRASAGLGETPQCHYIYPDGPGDVSITVAYMRPDENLGGRGGEAGFDYVAGLNRAPDAHVQPVRAGQRGLRLSNGNIHVGIVLTGGRVLTVIAVPSLSGATVDRLIQATGEAFGH
jgi:hypothetical protein